ncbi:histidine kinase [Paenibacillus sp. HN-1]|uniref:sensor histidine kinase n=1 Tax=Paenibacillus TaxID=44249 RepID=UPI001CA93AF5|nr:MULTISPECIES: histidine kinase [Paenibacillus]MBY9078229.1 histidine kinase [Paenibacillus sp. CGMCC 1.18879]MBY9086112.1 histidine kinase [Paenibacillus sinensis]
MLKKINMKRFIYFFVFFLTLTLVLFYVMETMSARTLQQSLIQSSKNQVTYTNSMLEGVLSEARMYAIQYTTDNSVRYYEGQKQVLSVYDSQMKKNEIGAMISNTLVSSQSVEMVGIYWRSDGTFVSTVSDRSAVIPFREVTRRGWKTVNGSLYYFSVYPYIHQPSRPSDIQYIVGVKIKTEYLAGLLDKALNSDNADAFFLMGKSQLVGNRTVDSNIVEAAKGMIEPDPTQVLEYHYEANDGNYVILSQYIDSIDTYLVTYTRMNDFLNPLNRNHQVFFASILVILVIGLFVITMFYRNFYRNVYLLHKRFYQVEQGEYGTRIKENPGNEFDSLFKSFNHMVAQIQALFVSLETETELRQSAELKQLQAQINPHFLYNSLFFIMSMAKASPDAVMRMSKHLAEYYRYMTKTDSRNVTVASELELADHYLAIMALCKQIDYRIELPENIGARRIMPLMIQPIVENAIQHGIEQHQGAHRVFIEAEELGGGVRITVSNDGKGLTPEELSQLADNIGQEQAPPGTEGIGLWNINRRLKNSYGERSGLHFLTNEWGGLTVSLSIDFQLEEGE